MTRPPARLGLHWFQILLALSSHDCHGAAIVRAVLDQTSGALKLWPVKLYTSLAELADAGLIAELASGPEGESERRKYYRITAAGRRALEAEADQLERAVRLARTRLARSRA